MVAVIYMNMSDPVGPTSMQCTLLLAVYADGRARLQNKVCTPQSARAVAHRLSPNNCTGLHPTAQT
jgi:hypothetical protein